MSTPAEKDELACTYAALILHDTGQSITAEAINTIVSTAGLKIQAFWPNIFEKVLKERNLDDLLLAAGSGGGVASSGTTTTTTSGGGEVTGGTEDNQEEEKKEESEEAALEFDLFGS